MRQREAHVYPPLAKSTSTICMNRKELRGTFLKAFPEAVLCGRHSRGYDICTVVPIGGPSSIYEKSWQTYPSNHHCAASRRIYPSLFPRRALISCHCFLKGKP